MAVFVAVRMGGYEACVYQDHGSYPGVQYTASQSKGSPRCCVNCADVQMLVYASCTLNVIARYQLAIAKIDIGIQLPQWLLQAGVRRHLWRRSIVTSQQQLAVHMKGYAHWCSWLLMVGMLCSQGGLS